MAREAHDAGLVFDVPLLTHYVNSGSDPIRHNPLNRMYKVDNLILGAKMKVSRKKRASAFSGGLRRLTNERALSVRVASSAVNHFQEGGYEPANLKAFAGVTNGFEGIVEPVTALPEKGVDVMVLGGPFRCSRHGGLAPHRAEPRQQYPDTGFPSIGNERLSLAKHHL